MFFGIRKQKINSIEHEKGFLTPKNMAIFETFLDHFSKHKTLISES